MAVAEVLELADDWMDKPGLRFLRAELRHLLHFVQQRTRPLQDLPPASEEQSQKDDSLHFGQAWTPRSLVSSDPLDHGPQERPSQQQEEQPALDDCTPEIPASVCEHAPVAAKPESSGVLLQLEAQRQKRMASAREPSCTGRLAEPLVFDLVFTRLLNLRDFAAAASVCLSWNKILQQPLSCLGMFRNLLSKPRLTSLAPHLCLPEESLTSETNPEYLVGLLHLTAIGFGSSMPFFRLGEVFCSHFGSLTDNPRDQELLALMGRFPSASVALSLPNEGTFQNLTQLKNLRALTADFKSSGVLENTPLQNHLLLNLSRLTSLKELHVTSSAGNTSISPEDWCKFAENIASLQSLQKLTLGHVELPLQCCSRLEALKELEHLTLIGITVSLEVNILSWREREEAIADAFSFLQRLPRLNHLCVQSWINGAILHKNLVRPLTQLRQLELENAFEDVLFSIRRLSRLTSLRLVEPSLYLGHPGVDDTMPPALPELKSLIVFADHERFAVLLRCLGPRFPSLNSLAVVPLSRQCYPDLCHYTGLSACTALTTLHVAAPDHSLLSVALPLPLLEIFSIDGWDGRSYELKEATAVRLVRLVQRGFPRLRVVRMRQHKATPGALTRLATLKGVTVEAEGVPTAHFDPWTHVP